LVGFAGGRRGKTRAAVDGVTATAPIRADHTRSSRSPTFADDTNILAALNAGALGYLTKDAGRARIARPAHRT